MTVYRHDWRIYLAGAVAGLVAANHVLHWLPDNTVGDIITLLGSLGLYVLPSPAIRTGP